MGHQLTKICLAVCYTLFSGEDIGYFNLYVKVTIMLPMNDVNKKKKKKK